MSEIEEDKVVNINCLRLNRSRSKFCDCYRYRDKTPKYEIDTTNRIVECRYCQTMVDPFDALVNIALNYENIQDEVRRAINYRNELMNYKPYLREAKRYEQMMRNKDMLPVCPNCNEAFKWQDITRTINRKFLNRENRSL